MKKIVGEANFETLSLILDFIKQFSEGMGFCERELHDIILASEEVLVNIINHAYKDIKGDIEVTCCSVVGNSCGVSITFIDYGMPFNILEASVPDFSLSLEERRYGGLGIHIVKNLMNNVQYVRNSNRNILTIAKHYNLVETASSLFSVEP